MSLNDSKQQAQRWFPNVSFCPTWLCVPSELCPRHQSVCGLLSYGNSFSVMYLFFYHSDANGPPAAHVTTSLLTNTLAALRQIAVMNAMLHRLFLTFWSSCYSFSSDVQSCTGGVGRRQTESATQLPVSLRLQCLLHSPTGMKLASC